MQSEFQSRTFLHLVDDSKETKAIKDILKSPLGLAADVIACLFENRFGELRESLDEIKKFAGGVTRAEKLASEYSLAGYYAYMFSFHQYFNSSYRARQGKVLEKMLTEVIRDYGQCDQVPDRPVEMKRALNGIFGTRLPDLDMDAIGVDSNRKRSIIVQVRSRDDTGGTTAKGSLVDLLRAMIRTRKVPQHDILYLVGIWDARTGQQKASTIEKMHSSLSDLTKTSKKKFFRDISRGCRVSTRITLQLAYGRDQISRALFEWTRNRDRRMLRSISRKIELVSSWDDLWISYAIATLEVEAMHLSGFSNLRILDKLFRRVRGRFDFSSYDNLVRSIDGMARDMVPLWTKDSIPLRSLADKVHYIRDLLFLRACYEKIRT